MSKSIFHFSNDQAEGSFTLTLKLNVNHQIYFNANDLPDEIRQHFEYPNKKTHAYSDFTELGDDVERAIESYETSFIQEARTKIIAYYCEIADVGSSIEFRYKVLERIDLPDETWYEISRDHGRRGGVSIDKKHSPFNNSYDVKVKEMPWSAEREQWFKDVDLKIKAMVRFISKGLSKNSILLGRQIDNNVAKLMPAQEPENE